MNKTIIIPITVIGIVLVVTIGTAFGVKIVKQPNSLSSVTPGVPTQVSQPATTPTDTNVATGTMYKDGTYQAEGSYFSPNGHESVGVTLTVKSNNITAVSVSPDARDQQSREYENAFASGIGDIVVGKPLSSSFDVSEVNGSSLTGAGFTQALQLIRQKAQA